MQHQVPDLGFQYRSDLDGFASRGRAGQDEDTGADDGSDTECSQAPWTQRLVEALLGLLGSRDQRVDAFGPKEPVHLTLPLALHHLFDFFLQGSARYAGGPFGLGGSLLAGHALQFLTFGSISN